MKKQRRLFTTALVAASVMLGMAAPSTSQDYPARPVKFINQGGPGSGPDVVPCTALDEGFFSWRARQDAGRQAAVVWLAPDDHDYPWHR